MSGRGPLAGVGLGHLVPGHVPSSLKALGSHCRLQAGSDGIILGFRRLAWGCRVPTGNPAVSNKAWAREAERKRAGCSPCTGSTCSRQGPFPPHAGPQASCLGVLHHDPHTLLLAFSMSCELGGSAPLPSGDHIPRQRQSSHGHWVPFPAGLHRQSWDSPKEVGLTQQRCPAQPSPAGGKCGIKNGWLNLRVTTCCPQDCCPRRWVSCCQKIQELRATCRRMWVCMVLVMVVTVLTVTCGGAELSHVKIAQFKRAALGLGGVRRLLSWVWPRGEGRGH